MQFKLATVAALLASVASPALAGSEGVVVTSAIEKLTARVEDTAKVVEKLSITNFPKNFSIFASSYQDLLKLKNKQVSEAPRGIDPSSEPDVCNAFISFSEVEKDFLTKLIGQQGVIEQFKSTKPVVSLLQADESVSDEYYYNILGLVPSCKDDLEAKAKQVIDLFNDAVKVYSS